LKDELRPRKLMVELAALYRRRDTIQSVIRSVERYQLMKLPSVQRRSRRAPQTAT
jgi:hypothetical protein